MRKRLLLVAVSAVLFLSLQSAYANPFDIKTSDFAVLFGDGSLVSLPAALGEGGMGSTEISVSGGVSGTVAFAVWETTSTNLLVFVYDIHLHAGSASVESVLASNPSGLAPVTNPGFVGGLVTTSPFFSPGFGYVAPTTGDMGVTPLFTDLLSGDLRWYFSFPSYGTPIPAEGESVRLYAVFDVTNEVAVGTVELRDGIGGHGRGLVPIAAVAAPEPASLLLFSSGLLGLGLVVRMRRKVQRGR
jgi:hypothetical protein